jgi:hypothetical protein
MVATRMVQPLEMRVRHSRPRRLSKRTTEKTPTGQPVGVFNLGLQMLARLREAR